MLLSVLRLGTPHGNARCRSHDARVAEQTPVTLSAPRAPALPGTDTGAVDGAAPTSSVDPDPGGATNSGAMSRRFAKPESTQPRWAQHHHPELHRATITSSTHSHARRAPEINSGAFAQSDTRLLPSRRWWADREPHVPRTLDRPLGTERRPCAFPPTRRLARGTPPPRRRNSAPAATRARRAPPVPSPRKLRRQLDGLAPR
jgi:hypothetical protein